MPEAQRDWNILKDELFHKWKSHVYQDITDGGVCNCYDCREDRSNGIIHTFLKEALGMSFVPRNQDPLLDWNGYDTDVVYEEGEERFHLMMDAANRMYILNVGRIENWKNIHNASFSMRKVKYCYDCGVVHLNKNLNYFGTVDGKKRYMCNTCIERYIKCHDCKTMQKKNQAKIVWLDRDLSNPVEGTDYFYICKDCAAAHYAHCNTCGNMVKKEKVDQYPKKKNDRGNITYYNVCHDCRNEQAKCFDCARDFPKGFLSKWGKNLYCPSCAEKLKPIHRHAYSPLEMHFYRAKTEGNGQDNTLYFGFELEMELHHSWISSREAMAELLKERADKNRVYCVADGSLSNGVEMVSYPFTWEKLKEDRDHWTDVLIYARTKGWESATYDDSHPCGMHIHTSKAAWGTFQIYKMMKFMYDPANRPFLYYIGNREANQYCKFSSQDVEAMPKLAKEKRNLSRTHYNVVNLNDKRSEGMASGGPTIEFRLFRGTLEPLHFLKNLEFVYSVFKFTRDVGQDKIKLADYWNYIHSSKSFPALVEYLKDFDVNPYIGDDRICV
jgi:hypothetical protein